MPALQKWILVCDDEMGSRTSISMVLSLAGYFVKTANDGEEALMLIKQQPTHYKLVLVDNAMPRLDGIGLVRELRANAFTGKIVVVSGCLDAADCEAYNDLAVNDIMFKPFDIYALRDTVSNLVAG